MYPGGGNIRSNSSGLSRPPTCEPDNASRLVHTPIRLAKPKRTANMSETVKLNKYLEELHAQDIKYKRELSERRRLSARKKNEQPQTQSATKYRADAKIIQDIVIVNTPVLKKQVSMLTPQTGIRIDSKSKSANIFNQNAFDKQAEKEIPSNRRKHPFDDKRYQDLVESMSSVYLLSGFNENPNERLLKIINSNRALTKGNQSYDRVYERVSRIKSYDDNLKMFERSVSNLI
jgi:hypothetical protein